MFRWLKPPQALPAIQDKNTVDTQYRYWRTRTFYTIFIGYTFFYFTRKSFTFAMPSLSLDLGLDKSQLGILLSLLSLSYGISKFVSGLQGDRSNPRTFMAAGLILTGFVNIAFGFCSSMIGFAILWCLNGWFQGWGWPPCARMLTHWYSKKERGSWWALWSTSHNVGGASIPLLAAFAVHLGGWRTAMWIPGVLCILMGLFVLNRLRDTPESLGLPEIERFHGEEVEHEKIRSDLHWTELLWNYVLINPIIWFLAMANFFVYVIRTGINDWSVFYLIENNGMTNLQASATISWFEAGGLIGMLVAGWASDKLFRSNRGLINAIFILAVTVPVGLLWSIRAGHWMMDSMIMMLIGFFLFGPQMLIGCAAAEQSHKKAAATATGFAGCFAYLGAAFSGYPLGRLVEHYGWDAFFTVIIIAALLCVFCFLPIWYKETAKTTALPQMS